MTHPALTDAKALEEIAEMLRNPDGYWGDEMLEDIADIVANTGRDTNGDSTEPRTYAELAEDARETHGIEGLAGIVSELAERLATSEPRQEEPVLVLYGEGVSNVVPRPWPVGLRVRYPNGDVYRWTGERWTKR